MAIEAIYIALAFASFISFLGFYKEDYWMIIIAGLIFVFLGLNIFINGFIDLATTYSKMFGIVVIFFGAYFTIRGGVETIQNAL